MLPLQWLTLVILIKKITFSKLHSSLLHSSNHTLLNLLLNSKRGYWGLVEKEKTTLGCWITWSFSSLHDEVFSLSNYAKHKNNLMWIMWLYSCFPGNAIFFFINEKHNAWFQLICRIHIPIMLFLCSHIALRGKVWTLAFSSLLNPFVCAGRKQDYSTYHKWTTSLVIPWSNNKGCSVFRACEPCVLTVCSYSVQGITSK